MTGLADQDFLKRDSTQGGAAGTAQRPNQHPSHVGSRSKLELIIIHTQVLGTMCPFPFIHSSISLAQFTHAFGQEIRS